MNSTTKGIVAAVAVIVAFAAGTMIEFESDGDITLKVETEGPAEKIGEAIDQAADKAKP